MTYDTITRIPKTDSKVCDFSPFETYKKMEQAKARNIIHFHKKQSDKQSKSTLQEENNEEKETFSCQNEQQKVYLQTNYCII